MGIEEEHCYFKTQSKEIGGDGLERTTTNYYPVTISLITVFKECLTILFREKGIPFFLKTLSEELGHEPVKTEKPSLSSLLDFGYYEAMNRFKLTYLQYHQKRSLNNYEAAKEMGINESTFKTILTRAKKEFEDLKLS